MGEEDEIIDLHSMKVVELKQELRTRSLPVSGTKAELIDRLEKYMTEHEGVEAVDEEEIDEKVDEQPDKKSQVPEKVESPKPQTSLSLAEEDEEPAKPVKNIADSDKKQARTERFGSSDADDKLTKRLERFGTNNKKIHNNITGDTDTLKKRAERFGISSDQSTKSITKVENDDKKKTRAERFGLTAKITDSRSATDSELAAKRAKKFGTVGLGLGPGGDSDKKADRAARFAN